MKARLWGCTKLPGVTSRQIRKELLEIVDKPPGSIMAEVRAGVRVPEYDAVGPGQRITENSRRGLALELCDIRQVFAASPRFVVI